MVGPGKVGAPRGPLNHVLPTFLNRIDDIVVFHQLTENEIVQIIDLMLTRFSEIAPARSLVVDV